MYRRLAELCPLDKFALEDIVTKREFPGATDGRLLCFSLPRAGSPAKRVVATLVAEFGAAVVARVPGFAGGIEALRFWSARGGQHDYALVARDEDGFARWVTVRRLPYDKQSKTAKYQLLSSSRSGEASVAGLPKYHVAGRDYPCERVFVTEGILKAEVIADHLRCRVIGIYSTSVDAPTLAEVVRLAGLWGAPNFVIAFDADKHELDEGGKLIRPGVLRGETKLIQALSPIANVSAAEWEMSDGKGLDDLLVNGGSYRLVDRYEQPTPRPRVPTPCAEAGRVDGGDTLGDVRRETKEQITSRFKGDYSGTVVILAPQPGTGKTGSILSGLEASNWEATIAAATHQQADELVNRSQTENCQCAMPRGTCEEHRIVLKHDRGRSAENCGQFDIVQAAQRAGYGARTGQLICGTAKKPLCPLFWGCEYQAQFDEPGSHVAPVEMVTQRMNSTSTTSVVIFDDLESSRLISKWEIKEEMLQRVMTATKGKALRPLAAVLLRALGSATKAGSYHQAAYSQLDVAARSLGTTLEAVIARAAAATKLRPAPTLDGLRSAVPGQVLDLVEMLREELPLYQAGKPFTSGLRIRSDGIHIIRLATPVARSDGSNGLSGKQAVVLSSTPDPVLRAWVEALGLEVLDEYRPQVALPDRVPVIQDVSGFYGKTSTTTNDVAPLIARALGYIEELRPQRLGVVTHKHMQVEVAAGLGIPLERVLYFGNMRGSNALRDADVLLVIGTPGMSHEEAYWMACAAYRGASEPPSDHMRMEFQKYGGWRDSAGRGREIEVFTFVDRRVAEIYESARRDELIQAIYRCRPFDTEDSSDCRASRTVVLMTAHPIEGLPIDELRFHGNAARAEAALARRDAAWAEDALRLRDAELAA